MSAGLTKYKKEQERSKKEMELLFSDFMRNVTSNYKSSFLCHTMDMVTIGSLFCDNTYYVNGIDFFKWTATIMGPKEHLIIHLKLQKRSL